MSLWSPGSNVSLSEHALHLPLFLFPQLAARSSDNVGDTSGRTGIADLKIVFMTGENNLDALAVIVAFFLGALRAKGGQSTSGPSIGSGFLCDSCKYNHPNTCSLPDRPNATRCADYKRRGD